MDPNPVVQPSTTDAIVTAVWRFARMVIAVGLAAGITQVIAGMQGGVPLTAQQMSAIFTNAFIAAVIGGAADFLRAYAGGLVTSTGRMAKRGAAAVPVKLRQRAVTIWDRLPL